jgi:RNA polymerase sigma factor (sigma-70 family)
VENTNPFDDAVAARMKNNDEKAWVSFYTDGGDFLYRWGRARGLSELKAEILAQETLKYCADRIDRFVLKFKGAFQVWVLHMAEQFRSNQGGLDARTTPLTEAITATAKSDSWPTIKFTRDDLTLAQQAQLDKAIAVFNGLSPEDKQIIQLKIIEDQSYSAIAEELKIAEATARMRVCRALRKVKNELGVDQGKDPS